MQTKTLKTAAVTLLILTIGLFVLVIIGDYAISEFVSGPGQERVIRAFNNFKQIEFLILGTAFFIDVILWIVYIWKRKNEQLSQEQEILRKVQEERGESENLGGRKWESIESEESRK